MRINYAYNKYELKIHKASKEGDKYEIKRTENTDFDVREEIVKEG